MTNHLPQPTEFHEYYQQYIDLAIGQPLKEGLEIEGRETIRIFTEMPESKHGYRYDTGKWTPREMLHHIIDTERVFTYRALHFARAENVVLPGFDQDEFIDNSNANERPMSELIAEFKAVRSATLVFVKSCTDEVMQRMGTASNNPFSVRALLYITAGHELHHRKVLVERYL